ncbi:MAG: hypothetical protein JKX78_15730 [Alteromonadaceae bacterium]|nr:hypothetical protein [Alteromonadaceae bacterium]
MNDLDAIYASLKDLGLCKTGYQFSREYLGRAPNYYSVVKASDKQPGIAVMNMLYYSLVKQSMYLDGCDSATIIKAKTELDTLRQALAYGIQNRCLSEHQTPKE